MLSAFTDEETLSTIIGKHRYRGSLKEIVVNIPYRPDQPTSPFRGDAKDENVPTSLTLPNRDEGAIAAIDEFSAP